MPKLNSVWSIAQKNLSKNIFNFTIRYMNNTLPTKKNLCKWGLSSTSDCSFCLQPESLLHIVAGCSKYLNEGRYTWRHNSALHFIANSTKSVPDSVRYADLLGFVSPSVVTGNTLRPDLVLAISNKCLNILELTVGFENNLLSNFSRKKNKYANSIRSQSKKIEDCKLISLSVSTLGVFSLHSKDFPDVLKDVGFHEQRKRYMIKTITNIAIRTTYLLLCARGIIQNSF